MNLDAANDDADSALIALRKEAATGVPDALFRLAGALVEREEMEEAFGLCRLAASAGHSGAQVEYARMLLHGLGSVADPAMAVEWFLRAEGLGNPIAGYYLALIALGSVVLPRDGRINQRLLTAVQHDYPPALRAAAIHFGRRRDAESQATCIKLLDRGAGRGDVIAALLLAERLFRGEGCDAQPEAAETLWARLAEHGVLRLPSITLPLPQPVLPLRESGEIASDTLAFEEALQPAPWEVLSTQPRVMQIDGLLSADECRLLIASAQLHERNATLTAVSEDFALRVTQLRMARSARSELGQAEYLIVHRQPSGPAQPPCHDYLTDDALAEDHPQAGNRRRTICVYLSHVEAGGETEFPAVPLQITPQPGRAVVYDNFAPDGLRDVQSLHGGLPVLRGDKWLAALFFRQRVYRGF